MCRVLNKHHAGVSAGAVYIGRGSKWGNPFRIGPDGDRVAVIARSSAGLPISIISCARSTSFAGAISSASARRGPATAICCCGSRMPRVTRASRGGAP